MARSGQYAWRRPSSNTALRRNQYSEGRKKAIAHAKKCLASLPQEDGARIAELVNMAVTSDRRLETTRDLNGLLRKIRGEQLGQPLAYFPRLRTFTQQGVKPDFWRALCTTTHLVLVRGSAVRTYSLSE